MKTSHKLKKLPPKVDYNQLIKEMGEANRVLGNLNGLLANLPNQSLLISPLLTKEAVASSKIEGTQATIEEVFKYEAEGKNSEKDAKEQDIKEIINYRMAIHEAIELLKERPIGENFIKNLHRTLLNSVRGSSKDRGNFRRNPVFIGKLGASIENAIYIPPEVTELSGLISDWEVYVNSKNELDALVQIAIAHYQIEAIHPFLDGNGRIGRLLIPILLYEKGILSYPLLYVSEYLERNKDEYYSMLRMVDNEDNWEPWIQFFLKSIKEQALDTQNKILKMLDLYQTTKKSLDGFNSQYAIPLLDIIFENPVTSFRNIKHKLSAKSYQTIYNLLDKFQEQKILFEITGEKRDRIFVFDELMKIIR